MDELQGRVNTPGALVKKGAQGEATVLPQLAKPVVYAAAVAKTLPEHAQIAADNDKVLRHLLAATLTD